MLQIIGQPVVLQATQIKQRRTRQCITQSIKVAALVVGAMQQRTKDAWIGCTKAACHFTNSTAPEIKHGGWTHSVLLLKTH